MQPLKRDRRSELDKKNPRTGTSTHDIPVMRVERHLLTLAGVGQGMKHANAENADIGKRSFRTGGASDPKCQVAMAELHAGA